ncbi:hypothetical protein BKA67DRAFT_537027 [Truncatella angustata]|uniref:Uncharacterized protein n=1 Tax=Truncatella angustata TaxID=152316 RepID=A0A9P8ZXT2_9PEZI|nr:uncharacterized protein BKA67DRAFT_537027 [Truncatella angustata]KAH6653343.1 hypothetical protein BKA67DRAFT_537027 [Truncatella angustata]
MNLRFVGLLQSSTDNHLGVARERLERSDGKVVPVVTRVDARVPAARHAHTTPAVVADRSDPEPSASLAMRLRMTYISSLTANRGPLVPSRQISPWATGRGRGVRNRQNMLICDLKEWGRWAKRTFHGLIQYRGSTFAISVAIRTSDGRSACDMLNGVLSIGLRSN